MRILYGLMIREDFYKGQKLITPERHKEDWPGCPEYVIVTNINDTLDVVHYELDLYDSFGAGKLHSGLYFNEATEFKK